MMSKSFLALMLGLGFYGTVGAQQSTDSAATTKQFKNTIRYNISGPILFGFNYLVFGYERVLNDRQSMSMNVGQAVLPKVIDFSTDDATLEGTQQNKGYNVSVDYRFYLQKENKYKAPRGVYIGPFYSFNRFEREATWRLNQSGGTSNANTATTFDIHTIGGELGYQFMFGKRISLDLVLIGPGFANYKVKSVFYTNLTPDKKDKLLTSVKQLLEE